MMRVIGFLLLQLCLTGAAYAVNGGNTLNAGNISTNLTGEFVSLGRMLIGFFMLAGLVIAGRGLFVLRRSSEDPRGNPPLQGIIMILIGGLLTTVLGVMTIAPDSFLGEVWRAR